MVATTIHIDYQSASQEDLNARGWRVVAKIHDHILDRVEAGLYDRWPRTHHEWVETVMSAFEDLSLGKEDVECVNALAHQLYPEAKRASFANNLCDLVYTVFITRYAEEANGR